MIDLYTWTTPNGRKVSIALEELGLPYTVHAIDISKDEQFAPDFLKIAPNNRIPAIVDRDNNMSLMESGAILIYLADKTGKLLPKSGEARYRVIEWLMWQMGGPGPMLGQVHHFVKYNPGKAPYAEERYLKEAHRLYKVLNTRLEGRDFVADDYSIADIAIWPWISRFEWQTIDMKQYPNVKRWYETIAARPAVQKGYKVPKDMGPVPMPAEAGLDEETRTALVSRLIRPCCVVCRLRNAIELMPQPQTKPPSAPDLAELLRRAAAHHKRGELHEAESFIATCFAIEPNHFDALHLCGVLMHQRGRPVDALTTDGAALRANDRAAAAHSNYGIVLAALSATRKRWRATSARWRSSPAFADALL